MGRQTVVGLLLFALIVALAMPTLADELERTSTYLPLLQGRPAPDTPTPTHTSAPTATATPSFTPTPSPSPTATPTIPSTGVDVRVAPWCSNWDADGNDNDNLNDEYVCFQNHDSVAADMTDWVAQDASNKRYTFPPFVLAPAERVTLHTGSGTDTAEALYWGRGGAVWTNTGDTATLLDATGALVDEYTYPAP